MLELTTKAQYGLTALISLSEHYGKGLVQIKDIAKNHSIPQSYLEQLFNRMIKNGLIKSVRGSKGGYELASRPEDITLLQVIEALDGEVTVGKENGYDVVNEIFLEVETLVREKLNMSLSDILDRQRRHEQSIMFYI